MDFFETVFTRRSIRNYREDKVADNDIQTILRAAMSAPSAGNQQPWHFILVSEKPTLLQLSKALPYGKMIATAAIAIVVCGSVQGKWPMFWSQDCSAATQNILLASHDLGLAATWTGVYPVVERMDNIRKILSIPEEIRPFSVVPVGYSSTQGSRVDRFQENRIHHHLW